MNKFALRMVWGVVASSVTLGAAFGAQSPVVPGKYIVVLKRGIAVSKVAAEHGGAAEAVYTHAFNGFVCTLPEGRMNAMKQQGGVLSIEPDVVVGLGENAAVTRGTFAVTPPREVLPTGIARVDANLNTRADVSSVGIAILDTGISRIHPDLNVAGTVSYVRGNTTGEDDNGHGSHCAGVAAAKMNGFGVRGVAPNARLFGVKVLNRDGTGRLSQIISGLDWVMRNAKTRGIDVANMSLVFRGTSPSLDLAIANLVANGVTCVVAAGNKRTDASEFSPANHPDVICVSALADSDGAPGHQGPRTGYGRDDTLASFSNFGALVDIAAPGTKIFSTYRSGKYATLSGTSMAAPHVAGAAALYIASNPGATPAQIKAALLETAWEQTSMNGFTADRDAHAEPLLNASGL